MAISNEQRIDYLIKKIGFGVTKTDIFARKDPSNETINSSLLIRGDRIWVRADLIPSTPPATTTTTVQVYKGTNRIQCIVDTTAATNRTWLTNLSDWISTEFGLNYQVAVYIDNAGAANPSITGTRIFPAGSGNNDSWFFDYQSGVLNFADTNVPSELTTGKRVFIEGYRYIDMLGLEDLVNTLQEGPITGDLYGSVYSKDAELLVDAENGRLILSYNTTDNLPEGGSNLYYSKKRAQNDARIISLIFGS
jgi:hypothetical protein